MGYEWAICKCYFCARCTNPVWSHVLWFDFLLINNFHGWEYWMNTDVDWPMDSYPNAVMHVILVNWFTLGDFVASKLRKLTICRLVEMERMCAWRDVESRWRHTVPVMLRNVTSCLTISTATLQLRKWSQLIRWLRRKSELRSWLDLTSCCCLHLKRVTQCI